MKSNVVQIRMDDELYNMFKEHASKNAATISTTIRQLAKEGLEYRKIGITPEIAKQTMNQIFDK